MFKYLLGRLLVEPCPQGWTGSQKVTGDFLKQPTPPTGPPAHTGPRRADARTLRALRTSPGPIRITPHFTFKDSFKHTTTLQNRLALAEKNSCQIYTYCWELLLVGQVLVRAMVTEYTVDTIQGKVYKFTFYVFKGKGCIQASMY